FGGLGGQLAAVLLGVDVAAYAYLGQIAGALAGNLAQPLHRGAYRPAVCLDRILLDQLHQLGALARARMHGVDVGARNDSFHQAFLRHAIHAADVHGVARAAGEIEGQVPGAIALVEPIAQALQQFIGSDPADHADTRNGLAVLDIRYRFLQGAYLAHALTPNFFKVA